MSDDNDNNDNGVAKAGVTIGGGVVLAIICLPAAIAVGVLWGAHKTVKGGIDIHNMWTDRSRGNTQEATQQETAPAQQPKAVRSGEPDHVAEPGTETTPLNAVGENSTTGMPDDTGTIVDMPGRDRQQNGSKSVGAASGVEANAKKATQGLDSAADMEQDRGQSAELLAKKQQTASAVGQ